MNCKFKLNLCCSEFEDEMETYGHLLHCPLCQELYTHPVLLPCQHSLCYGCARAQILSSETLNDFQDWSTERRPRKPDSDDASYNASPPSSPHLRKRTYTVDTKNSHSFDVTSKSEDSESLASFVLSTNDLLHFEPEGGSRKGTPRIKVRSPPSSSFKPSSVLNSTSKQTNLRRSQSASSVQRPKSLQKNYMSLKRSRVKSLFCPNCEMKVELGNLGISGLFRNFALESIVERFRTAARAVVAVRCGYCKPPACDATKSCLDCKLSYCNECFKVVHIWGTKKAQHDFVGPTNNFTRPKVLLCPEHSNEVSLYCNKCKKSVCRQCKLRGGAHVNHSVSSAKSAYREGRDRLFADLEILKCKKEEIDAKVVHLGEAFTDLERRDAETRERIHTSLDGMHRVLDAKRNELLSKVEINAREKEYALRQEMQRCHHLLMKTSISSFAEEILKETDPNFFLQTSRMVEMKMKEAITSASEISNQHPSNVMASYDLDLSKARDLLENLDFVSTSVGIAQPEENLRSDENQSGGEDMQWILPEDNKCIVLENNRKVAKIGRNISVPCILKGATAYSAGNHYWEITVTSYNAKQMLIGFCNVASDDKLHGSINYVSSGVLIKVVFGSAYMVNENPTADILYMAQDVPEKELCCVIGRHCLTIGVELHIHGEEAIVQFFDVKEEPQKQSKELFSKKITNYLPLRPLVIVDGEALVSIN